MASGGDPSMVPIISLTHVIEIFEFPAAAVIANHDFADVATHDLAECPKVLSLLLRQLV